MPVLNNPRWERFAQEIAKGIDGATAYRTAGYKTNAKAAAVSANRLLKDAKVIARVNELLAARDEMHVKATEKAAEALAIDRGWILERLVENANRAMQAVEVMDAKGIPTGEWRYEGSVANRALELLGKELGMFIDRKEVKHQVENLSDAELDAALSRRLGIGGDEPGGEDRPSRTAH